MASSMKSSTAVIIEFLCNSIGKEPALVAQAMIEKLKLIALEPRTKPSLDSVENKSPTPTPSSGGVTFSRPHQ